MTRRICTFAIEDRMFGLDIAQIQEILPHTELTPVPLAPPYVLGLFNLRGDIITVINLRRRLQLPAHSAPEMTFHLIIRAGDAAVAVQVDRVGDVIEVDEDDFAPPPRTLAPHVQALLEGIYMLEDTLLLVAHAESITTLSAPSATRPSAGG